MLVFYFVIWVLFWLSLFLFESMRIYLSVMNMALGSTLLLNDWNNAVVPDDTTKLSFLLGVFLYAFMFFYTVWHEESTENKIRRMT